VGAEFFSSPDAATRVVLFLLPGLIARWAWKAVVVAESADEKTELLKCIVASAWLYVPLIPLIHGRWGSDLAQSSPNVFAGLFLAGLFIWPIIAGLAAAKLMATNRWRALTSALDVRHPEPRAWDAFFARRERCFVRVNFEDGEVIGGLLDARSVVSTYPASEDLFVEATFYLDPETKKLTTPVPRTMGAWIDMKKVKYLEFFSVQKWEVIDAKESNT
jgi:hypothetical protein